MSTPIRITDASDRIQHQSTISAPVYAPQSQHQAKPAYCVIPKPRPITFGIIHEGAPKKWDFFVTHILQISEDIDCIDNVKLLVPTYIKTNVKINCLKGEILIIANSLNIGKVYAKTVVLFESQADYVAADNFYLFHSYVKGDVRVEKRFESVLRPILPGVESSVSFVSEGSTSSVKFNDKGEIDLTLSAGTVINPTFTTGGSLRQGEITLTGSSTVKASDLDCPICNEKLLAKKEAILDCTFKHKTCLDCAMKLFGKMKEGTVQTSELCPWRCVKPVTSYNVNYFVKEKENKKKGK